LENIFTLSIDAIQKDEDVPDVAVTRQVHPMLFSEPFKPAHACYLLEGQPAVVEDQIKLT
jgi:hypothetical protein